MTASSVSTFLDVREASVAGPPPAPVDDPRAMTNAATVLAAINDGAQALDGILRKSSLSPPDAIDALSWLQRAGLVTLSEADKGLRAELTSEAMTALR